MNKKTLIIILVILGFAIRLISINQSLWLDEAISIQAVSNYSFNSLINQFIPKDFNPPFYYLFLKIWLMIFPSSEFFLRLPSIIFSLLTAIFGYKIFNLIYQDDYKSILTLSLILSSPLLIYYSQEIRAYSLLAMLASASMYNFIRLIKFNDVQSNLFYILFSLLLIYTHYFGWFIITLQVIYVLFFKKRYLKIYAFLTLYFPWIPILIQQIRVGQRGLESNEVWTKVLGIIDFKSIALIPIKFIIGRITIDNKFYYALIALILISLFLILLLKSFKKTSKPIEYALWMWLILPLLLGIIISFKLPMMAYFRFIFCLPALYILLTNATDNKKIFSLLIAINLFFSFIYLLNDRFHRENWKNAVYELHQMNHSNAVFIYKNVSAPFEYYDKNVSILLSTDQKEVSVSRKTIWFIPYAQPILDPSDSFRNYLKENNFFRTYEKHFNGVTLEKWQKMIAFVYNKNNEDSH